MPGTTIKRRELMRMSAMGAAAAMIAACAPSSGSGPAAVLPKTDTSKLVIAQANLGTQRWAPWLSSTSNDITHLIGETLTAANPKTRKLEGRLAESWTLSPDLRTWTFKLRPNVPFQDGYGTVTAEDVKLSWEQYIRPDGSSVDPVFYRDAIANDMKNFEILGPLEFRTKAAKPINYLATAISDSKPGLAIQSKKYFDTKPAEALERPLGTGPFKFVSAVKDVEVVLAAVENHWRQTSAFKAITFKQIADDAARLAQVASGAVDLAILSPALLGQAKSLGLQLLPQADIGTVTVMFGGMYPGDDKNYDRNSPWIQADNPARGLLIRQAMSLAIDRKTINDKFMGGLGALTHAPLFEYPGDPALVDPAWTLPEYNVAKAKQLLAQGGYPNGFDVMVPLYVQTDKTATLEIAEAVAGMFEAIGLKVARKPMDYNPGFRDLLVKRTTAGYVNVSVITYSDEVAAVLSNNFTPQSGTGRFYMPDAIPQALTKLNAEPEITKRYDLTRELAGRIMKDQLAIAMFTYTNAWVATSRIGGWTPIAGLGRFNNAETILPKVP